MCAQQPTGFWAAKVQIPFTEGFCEWSRPGVFLHLQWINDNCRTCVRCVRAGSSWFTWWSSSHSAPPSPSLTARMNTPGWRTAAPRPERLWWRGDLVLSPGCRTSPHPPLFPSPRRCAGETLPSLWHPPPPHRQAVTPWGRRKFCFVFFRIKILKLLFLYQLSSSRPFYAFI